MKLLILLFVLLEYYLHSHMPTTRLSDSVMETPKVDSMPSFLNNQPDGQYTFVRNFFNLSDKDLPKKDFRKKKNVTHFLTTTVSSGKILPTADYQSIYIFVSSGEAIFEVMMCPEGKIIQGGRVTKGWNMVALHFPTLLKMSECQHFDWEHDRPIYDLHGFGIFSVWQVHHCFFFKMPVNPVPILIKYAIDGVFYLLIIFKLFDIFIKYITPAPIEINSSA